MVLNAIFFTNKGPAIQIPVPTTERSQASSIKLRNYYKSRRPKTGLKYVRLLHDNAPAHKARIVTDFLESEKVTVLPHHPYSPVLAIFSFQNLNIIYLEGDTIREIPLDVLFISV